MSDNIITSCKDCCFAKYEELTQTGCELDNIYKINKESFGSVIEAYDEDREFYVLKRRCFQHRSSEWKSLAKDNWKALLEFETRVTIHFIIFATTAENLLKTLKSISNQTQKTVLLTVIKKLNCNLTIQDISKIVKDSGINIKWKVKHLLTDMEDSQAINQATKGLKASVYISSYDEYEFDSSVVELINNIITDDYKQFVLINIQDTAYCIPQHVHEYWYPNGNEYRNIYENIYDWCVENNETSKILYL